ncbi:alpha/beta fold hydrolase [Acidovorax cavernicola]|nr:alpha/beta hydrolase [Acidovorax cavernicola]
MSALSQYSANDLSARCRADGEFALCARHWTGGLRLEGDTDAVAIFVDDGRPSADGADEKFPTITLRASDEVWTALLKPLPPRFMNDIWPLIQTGQMHQGGDALIFAQYLPAITRAVELMRASATLRPTPPVVEAKPNGTYDSPVGRYIHLTLEGQDYRVYFEEAGSGIPLLLQHTAGCHGGQWRHLFECKEITDHFRLIAYDLPFHGKSIPPVGPRWWANEYKLAGGFLRSVPLALSRALELDRPVFMGCSVGGMLALDLARYHADELRAVISLEGALKVDFDVNSPALRPFWHPQVSNEHKARVMDALMCPASPEAYRKETTQVYAAAWPPVFIGDLNYYMSDYDLRNEASKINTQKVAVHILSGEYDWSGTMEKGKEAHEAIIGSTWQGMEGLGHFPMTENPEKFLKYLLPVLESLRSSDTAIRST